MVACACPALGQDYLSHYKYRTEIGGDTPECKQMARVYNLAFGEPFKFLVSDSSSDPYPRFSGIERQQLRAFEVGMLLSRHPRSPEFDRIQWREGRLQWTSSDKSAAPMLAANFDIDNDGKDELVIKVSFMFSFYPAGTGAPGGEDELLVIKGGAFDFSKPVSAEALYDASRNRHVSRIAADLLGLNARLIRPFIHGGKTYLHIYEQDAMTNDKERREFTHILQYEGGGTRTPSGEWTALKVRHVCRFRMVLTN
jgi:hypothetical protein